MLECKYKFEVDLIQKHITVSYDGNTITDDALQEIKDICERWMWLHTYIGFTKQYISVIDNEIFDDNEILQDNIYHHYGIVGIDDSINTEFSFDSDSDDSRINYFE